MQVSLLQQRCIQHAKTGPLCYSFY